MPRMTRRKFLQATAATGVGFWASGTAAGADDAKKQSPNDRLRIACIGVGGKGSSDTDQAANVGELVALCDIDDNFLGAKATKHPNAKKYHDFRKLLEEMEGKIDAVVVSTPDHTHAPAAAMAMRMKKHVYCQKPLTHTVKEARLLRELARSSGVCTQMGNQGTAEDGLRRAAELVQAGVLGAVKEVHVWTNRPVWPQAPVVMARPAEVAVPKHVHWDEFIGPAPFRPYAEYAAADQTKRGKGAYHSFNWRGWWDFGTGALGDMACHTANMAFMALKLGYPTSVTGMAGDLNPETCPSWARVVFQFPSRDAMPACTFTWYEGKKDGKKVLPPQDLVERCLKLLPTKPGAKEPPKLADSGSIIVGDKGILFSPSDYGAQYYLSDGLTDAGVAKSLPRNGKGDQGMKNEWAKAIHENNPKLAVSNFEYGGMLTETILLGNCAIRTPGETLLWDGPAMRFTNSAAANALLHYEYRKGWTL